MLDTIQTLIIEAGRMGMGIIFLISIIVDFRGRAKIFELMDRKKVPVPILFFISASLWKLITSIGLILKIYPVWSAILLASYIFIANIIFNNFWAVPKEQRDFSSSLFLVYLAVCLGLLVIAVVS